MTGGGNEKNPIQCTDWEYSAEVQELHQSKTTGIQFINKNQRTNSPNLSPYFSYKSTVETLLKYQENSPWVIISSILMTPGVE